MFLWKTISDVGFKNQMEENLVLLSLGACRRYGMPEGSLLPACSIAEERVGEKKQYLSRYRQHKNLFLYMMSSKNVQFSSLLNIFCLTSSRTCYL
jgi:hypothetical protein